MILSNLPDVALFRILTFCSPKGFSILRFSCRRIFLLISSTSVLPQRASARRITTLFARSAFDKAHIRIIKHDDDFRMTRIADDETGIRVLALHPLNNKDRKMDAIFWTSFPGRTLTLGPYQGWLDMYRPVVGGWLMDDTDRSSIQDKSFFSDWMLFYFDGTDDDNRYDELFYVDHVSNRILSNQTALARAWSDFVARLPVDPDSEKDVVGQFPADPDSDEDLAVEASVDPGTEEAPETHDNSDDDDWNYNIRTDTQIYGSRMIFVKPVGRRTYLGVFHMCRPTEVPGDFGVHDWKSDAAKCLWVKGFQNYQSSLLMDTFVLVELKTQHSIHLILDVESGALLGSVSFSGSAVAPTFHRSSGNEGKMMMRRSRHFLAYRRGMRLWVWSLPFCKEIVRGTEVTALARANGDIHISDDGFISFLTSSNSVIVMDANSNSVEEHVGGDHGDFWIVYEKDGRREVAFMNYSPFI
ncbi:hypothetical protein BJ742DRAFT_794535 [Cladochytrium replicatum]|nr:hypothetical protein BJ742DRAFT_794535 [Cladochytrium replicatum]